MTGTFPQHAYITVEQAIEAKSQLQEDILARVQKFVNETGLDVTSLQLSTLQYQRFDQRRKRTLPSSVSVEVDL